MATPRTNRKSANSTAFIARLAALLVVAVVTLTLVLFMRSPMSITEDDVRGILARGELIGLSVEQATARLHHAPPNPPVVDGVILLDFQHIRGWRAAGVELEVRGGQVTAAHWESTAPQTAPQTTPR